MTHAGRHILYVITDLELGGVPLHLHRLAVAMRGRGWCISVASLAPPGPVGDLLRDAGISVFSCRGRGGWDYHVIGRLADIIDQARPDLIHSFLFHANLAARFAAVSRGFPRDRLLGEIQTVEVERRWHLWVDRLTHRLGRLTIGNSTSVIDHLHRNAGIPSHRLRLVRGGIDVDRIQAAEPIDSAVLGLHADDRIVLWVGRLDPVKGLDNLIRAFEPIARESKALLLLVGDGECRSDVEQLVAALGVGERVRFLGPRTDVPSLLKMAAVFAFPSRTEGLPNALLEAMAAGCPIVTTDVPGCCDLIAHEESGLRVPFGDISALSMAIRRLLDDRELAARFSSAAERSAREDWNLNVTFCEYEALYHRALGIGEQEQ